MDLVEFPFDILDIVFSYLDAKSFVAVCSTCKALNQRNVRLNPTFWRNATKQTFRVPNQPVTHGDGSRWQNLYRRLLTQSRVYTWGNSDHGALGHEHSPPDAPVFPPGPRRQIVNHLPYRESWPTEMANSRHVGTIADMQAGGWSTTILNSKGELHLVGKLDQLRFHAHQLDGGKTGLLPLKYPPGFPTPVEYPVHIAAGAHLWDPCTAIRQFSSGRSHVLGLSDSGRIWSWDDEAEPCLHLKFLHFDVKEMTEADRKISAGSVTKVVAGWDKSSAYVIGSGIVIWEVAHLPRRDVAHRPTHIDPRDLETPGIVDTILIADSDVIPRTGYRRPKGLAREPDLESQALGEEIGEVVNWIVLENFIVLVTDIGKVFTAKITSTENQPLSVSPPVEITDLKSQSSSSSPTNDDFIVDVQGSFRRFAVFKRSGEVLIADTTLLSLCYEAYYGSTSLVTVPPPSPKKIHALQNTGVVALAFGDYHMHALHAAGHITSYGTEPQHCGALGLGGLNGNTEGRLRGINRAVAAFDGKLLPQCYQSGRRVWFETEKNAWIKFMASGGVNPEEARERMAMVHREPSVQAELSEWIEQRGNHWYGDSDGDFEPQNQSKDDENDGLGAYFALSVTAAGWHSGALVLVNDELAQKSRAKCIIPDPESQQQQRDTATETSQATPSQHPEQHGQANGWSPTALLSSARATLHTWSRWFLGLPDRAGSSPPVLNPWSRWRLGLQERAGGTQRARLHGTADNSSPAVQRPSGFGPEPRGKWVWAEEPFPRLRLSDGREMPGEVEFAEWIGERPDFGGLEDVEF